MIKFTAVIKKFGSKGEKTGWTYIDIPAHLSAELKPQYKKAYRVRGKIEDHDFRWVSLVPMGEGDYILALNAKMRKGIKKKEGAMVTVLLEEDDEEKELNETLMDCLEDAPLAQQKFLAMPRSHQMYYSNWIESCKTDKTKAKRIMLVIQAMEQNMSFAEMLSIPK